MPKRPKEDPVQDAPEPRPDRRVTLKDVARVADVSLASASYAVNGTGSVSEQVRAHVLKIAAELGYRQNLTAKAMRTGRSGTLGLILPDLSNPFFTSLAQSVTRAARANGYFVFVTDTEGAAAQEKQIIELLTERGVDGLVWFPIRDIGSGAPMTGDLPTIVIDRSVSGLETVQADYYDGGRQAAEHLLSLGHRRIGVISGPMSLRSMRERCAGAIDLIRAEGELVFDIPAAFSPDLDEAAIAAIRSRKATAIFAGADLIALGVIHKAQAAGLSVPGDLSVVGFDDIPWSRMSVPALTSVEMPVEEIAQEAVESLLRRIESKAMPRRRVVFDTNLIARASSTTLK
ncbi:LacI family DNA-binding transcriptional regulator [Asticcacaulis sp. AND118]|uniref:LacI family DNA-binding transcriptional regulator n=1 Tax=Asticcacaulis sp. AND118 TaxID=2840468 RepID=UPI001D00096A|nr:LacI family DNA-binding transcriptional regulator [Asticcacaulis sp. AND118]UDF03028.1 LacI family transcriptional regulator [Asticcacaulis sp. AND118]